MPRPRTLPAVLLLAGIVLFAAAPARPAPAGAARLDGGLTPSFESIRLELDPARPEYTGSVHVELDGRRATTSFTLHARGQTIRTLVLKGKDGEIATKYAAEGDRLRVTPARALAPGGVYWLDIEFTAPFDTQAAGLYRMKVDEDWYAFTQFEATDARGAFPCWDEPAFKIPFRLTLVVPEAHLAVSNTPISEETVAEGKRTVVFEKTPPLPSYLLAIATGPLETVPMQGMSVPGRVVTARGAAGLAGEAARVTPPLVAALEKYFGIPYPYRKLDILAVPEFWPGAMENAGAITFADRILLIDPRAASGEQRQTLIAVDAHELAHMWFGDLVTMRWWDDLWLNESFASWMGDKVADEVFPEGKLRTVQVDSMQRAMRTDARPSTRAMRQPVDDVENLDQLADELAYDKGQAVLTMFEAWLGPDTFRRGVIAYLQAHKWGSATGADLWSALSKAAKKDVAGPMATFLDRPGVPLVTAEPLPGGRVRLSQKRLLNGAPEAAPAAAGAGAQTWKIPMVVKFSGGGAAPRTKTVLLSQPSAVVTLAASGRIAWIHPNAGETGYYRWRVPTSMLDALAAAGPNGLDTRERIGFLGNLGALLDAGAVHGDDDLKLLSRFAGDPEPEVIGALIDHLGKVKESFVVDDLKGPFVAYVRRTLLPALERFGRTRVEGEPETVSLLRPTLIEWLAVEGGDDALHAECARLAHAWLDDPASIDPSLTAAALRVAAVRGDEALFEAMRARFETAKVPADRARLLEALGSFRRKDLIDRALRYSLEGPLRPQEILAIPGRLAELPENRPRVWRWIADNFKAIVARVPANYGVYLAHFASGCSDDLLQPARAFFASPDHEVPGMSTEMKKVEDEVNDCSRLRRREQPAVASYLTQARGQGAGASVP